MSNIDITRKKGESFEAMFRRYSRRLQQSGKVLTIRAGQFFEKHPSKNKMQESAIRRLQKSAKREYLIRTGKISEEELRGKRRRR